MANLNAPRGLSPIRQGNGVAWNEQITTYWIPAADTNQYNIGDIVKPIAGSDAIGIPRCTKSASSDATPARGVIVGIAANPGVTLNVINAPATKSQDYYLYVVDDPTVVFEITDDGITTANLVATAVGKNAGYTVANPTAPSPVSATVLLSSSIATTNTLPLKIVGLKLTPGNSAGPYAAWLVRFNIHDFGNNATAGL
jgi:hypothetical protein